MMKLTPENYQKGFLVDEELMAGVSTDPQTPQTYIAFVVRHTTGEYLGYESFPELELALERMNRIPRPWVFQGMGNCGGACATGGGCQGGGCQAACNSSQSGACSLPEAQLGAE